jgi:SAM-dependent methyltransferase
MKPQNEFFQMMKRQRASVTSFEDYWKRMKEEMVDLIPYLPHCRNLLDIGCGLGGIDVEMYHHYLGEIDLFLLDKTETTTEEKYKYGKKPVFYNSLAKTKEVLMSNRVKEEHIHLVEANEGCLTPYKDESMDIILSLLSWCFHYPVDVYLEEVKRLLSPTGVLIVDVRKHTGQLELLQGAFPKETEILEGKAHYRMRYSK